MGISGVGSIYNYNSNTQANRLSQSGVPKRNGFSLLPMGTENVGLDRRQGFLSAFKKNISDMNTMGEYGIAQEYDTALSFYEKTAGTQGATSRQSATANVTRYDGAVEDFKRKHPEETSHIDKQVSAGMKAKEMYGISGVDTSEMSMDEYKAYITDILEKIPFHASHPYDEEAIYISDEGWEQMKNDPEYEAWVLGYNVENRSVPNPFFGMGDKGSYAIEHFGATIEEHHGEGYSKVYGGTAAGARAMFEGMASGKGAIRSSAPQASLQPPKDWSLAEEQRKARKKKNRKLWDEYYEARLYAKKEDDARLTRKRIEDMRSSMID